MMRFFGGAAASSTAAAAAEYSAKDFGNVAVHALSSEADTPGPAAPLGDLWKDRGAVVMVVRRPG